MWLYATAAEGLGLSSLTRRLSGGEIHDDGDGLKPILRKQAGHFCKKSAKFARLLVLNHLRPVWCADDGHVGETLGKDAVGDDTGDVVDRVFHFERL